MKGTKKFPCLAKANNLCNQKPTTCKTYHTTTIVMPSSASSTTNQAITAQSQAFSDRNPPHPTRALPFYPNTAGYPIEFASGVAAGLANILLMFPLNKVIFRQMSGGFKFRTAKDQLVQEGGKFIYRGVLPPLLQKMATVSIMYGSYDFYKKLADKKIPNSKHFARVSIAAIMTGSTEAILTPLERIQMLLQDRNYHNNYKNTLDTGQKLMKFGFKEYYRGLTCVLIRNCPSNIMFFFFKDEIRLSKTCQHLFQSSSSYSKLESWKQYMNYIDNFASGAILGMLISTIFYPLSVIRTRMQTRAPGTPFLSIVGAFKAIYSERDRQFKKFFYGCSANMMRQSLSWGITNFVYDFTVHKFNKNGVT